MKKIYTIISVFLAASAASPQTDSLKEGNETITIIWQKEGESSSVPLLVKDDKIISTENDKIICYNLKGDLLWQYNASGSITSKPALEGDVLAAATVEGDLLTINSNNGELIQVIGLGESLTSDLQIIDINYNGMKTKGVVTGSENGNLYCYGLYSLEFIWENNSEEGTIEGLLLQGNKIIYSSGNNLCCIDASSGSLIWKWNGGNEIDSSFSSSFLSDGKNVFTTASDGSLIAVDLLLGTTIWKKKFSVQGHIGMSENNLFAVNDKNLFLILLKKDGSIVKRIGPDEESRKMNFTPVFWKDNIIFGTDTGDLFLIDAAYNVKTIFSSGKSAIISIHHVNEDVFALSNADGDILIFKIN